MKFGKTKTKPFSSQPFAQPNATGTSVPAVRPGVFKTNVVAYLPHNSILVADPDKGFVLREIDRKGDKGSETLMSCLSLSVYGGGSEKKAVLESGRIEI